MNVYDNANELAQAMRETQDFNKVKEAKIKLDGDATAKQLVDDFLKLSQEVEMAKYQQQDVPADKSEKLQNLTNLLSMNADATEYLNTFIRFQMMMQDISKTITDVVKEALGE